VRFNYNCLPEAGGIVWAKITPEVTLLHPLGSTSKYYLHKSTSQVADEHVTDPFNLHAVNADLQVSSLCPFQICLLQGKEKRN